MENPRVLPSSWPISSAAMNLVAFLFLITWRWAATCGPWWYPPRFLRLPDRLSKATFVLVFALPGRSSLREAITHLWLVILSPGHYLGQWLRASCPWTIVPTHISVVPALNFPRDFLILILPRLFVHRFPGRTSSLVYKVWAFGSVACCERSVDRRSCVQ